MCFIILYFFQVMSSLSVLELMPLVMSTARLLISANNNVSFMGITVLYHCICLGLLDCECLLL